MYKMYIMEIEIQRKESSNQNKKGPSKLITKSYPKSKARKNSSKIQHYPLLIKIKNYIKRTPLCVFLIQQGYDFAFPVLKTYKYHSPKDPTTSTKPKPAMKKQQPTHTLSWLPKTHLASTTTKIQIRSPKCIKTTSAASPQQAQNRFPSPFVKQTIRHK
jgi:hypothetical protein